MMILIQTFGKCVKKQTYVVKMTLIVKEIIDTLNDLKQFCFDKDECIVNVKINNKIYNVSNIKLDENKNITLECEYFMEE